MTLLSMVSCRQMMPKLGNSSDFIPEVPSEQEGFAITTKQHSKVSLEQRGLVLWQTPRQPKYKPSEAPIRSISMLICLAQVPSHYRFYLGKASMHQIISSFLCTIIKIQMLTQPDSCIEFMKNWLQVIYLKSV